MYAEIALLSSFDAKNYNKQVRGEAAQRIYFVNDITNHFIAKTEKKSLEIVAKITASYFDCDFTSSEVARIIRGRDFDQYYMLDWYTWANHEDWIDDYKPYHALFVGTDRN
jgi:hypothetical protein